MNNANCWWGKLLLVEIPGVVTRQRQSLKIFLLQWFVPSFSAPSRINTERDNGTAQVWWNKVHQGGVNGKLDVALKDRNRKFYHRASGRISVTIYGFLTFGSQRQVSISFSLQLCFQFLQHLRFAECQLPQMNASPCADKFHFVQRFLFSIKVCFLKQKCRWSHREKNVRRRHRRKGKHSIKAFKLEKAAHLEE